MPTPATIFELLSYTGLAVAGLAQCLQWLGFGKGAGVEPLPWAHELEE